MLILDKQNAELVLREKNGRLHDGVFLLAFGKDTCVSVSGHHVDIEKWGPCAERWSEHYATTQEFAKAYGLQS